MPAEALKVKTQTLRAGPDYVSEDRAVVQRFTLLLEHETVSDSRQRILCCRYFSVEQTQRQNPSRPFAFRFARFAPVEAFIDLTMPAKDRRIAISVRESPKCACRSKRRSRPSGSRVREPRQATGVSCASVKIRFSRLAFFRPSVVRLAGLRAFPIAPVVGLGKDRRNDRLHRLCVPPGQALPRFLRSERRDLPPSRYRIGASARRRDQMIPYQR